MSVRDALEGAGGGTVRELAEDWNLRQPISVRELLAFAEDNRDAQRPFWLIAHRCNDLPEVRAMVRDGANAIECDVRPTDGPIEFVVNHDNDWAEQRDALRPYLDGLVEILRDNPQVALIIFDCKDAGVMNPGRLREIVRARLTSKVDVHVLFSVASFSDRHFFRSLNDDVRPNEGYAIDEDDDHERVQAFFEEIGIERCGFGNGIAVPVPKPSLHDCILGAVARKYRHRRLRMVYVWTLADEDSMRDYLRMGVDGIFVNDVAELRKVTKKFSGSVRLATRADDPFAPPRRGAYVLRVHTADRGSAGTDANLTFRVVGNRGELATTLNSQPAGLFERGSAHDFAIVGRHVGRLEKLVISMDDQGNGPDWFVKKVGLRATGTDDLHEWNVQREVTDDDPLTLEA